MNQIFGNDNQKKKNNYDNYYNSYNTNYSNNRNVNDRNFNNFNQRNYGQNYNYSNYNQRQNNQNYNYANNNKADIKTVVRIFSIIIMIFGIILIGKSAYALTTEHNKKRDNVVVSVDKMGKELTISINSNYPIKEFTYKWGDGETTKIEGNETTEISKIIDIPNGNNILKLSVIDFYGHKTQYNKQYIYESTDIVKPVIDISSTGTKIKITAKDETKLSYMTIKWNDEEETRFDAEEGQNEISQEIEIEQGENKLVVSAVDSEDNKATITKSIIGDNKPEISLSAEGNNIVVIAKDDEGITKISVTVDGQKAEQELNQKEVTAKIPVTNGNHNISATVTNVNGLTNTKEITASI